MAKTAVVILNWNGREYLKMFLGKVTEKTGGCDADVYVADNGSDDGSAEYVQAFHKNVKLIRFDRNHGFAEGYNLALRQIEAEYFVLLNSDIEVKEGWLEPLVDCLEKNPGTASCQPKILSFKNKDYFEYAGAAGGFIDRLGYPLCRGRILDHIEKDEGQYDSPVDLFWSSGACMAVRAEAWEKAGGFDPDFFAHMEEIDLCWRFHRMGYKVAFIPQSTVYHVGGGTLPYDSPLKTYLNFRNSFYLLYKNLPDRYFRRVITTRKILDGVAAIFFLLKGHARSVKSVWKAHREIKRQTESLMEKRETVKSLGKNYPSELILNKCIVFEFYILKHRTFKSLKTGI